MMILSWQQGHLEGIVLVTMGKDLSDNMPCRQIRKCLNVCVDDASKTWNFKEEQMKGDHQNELETRPDERISATFGTAMN
jgi:hypothetical protein